MKTEQTNPHYKIVIIGANGGTGKQAVEQALQEGHEVTAILRNPGNLLLTHPRLEIVKGDIMQTGSLEKFLTDKDIVISAIGKTSFKKTNLYSQGNKNLLSAMKNARIRRVFFISASGLEVNPSHSFMVRFATKYILQKLLINMYADLERMEKIIKESQLDWTIMRPPQLTDIPATGKYRFSIDKFLENGLKISRADLAHFMLHNIANESIYRKTVEVAY
jgi:putative NADH-flavin reductase